ncbi:MAG: c-type cytochrome [Chloroflexi bacterium]|nr:c-type cytochrome [Chloroflexota bacterium]
MRKRSNWLFGIGLMITLVIAMVAIFVTPLTAASTESKRTTAVPAHTVSLSSVAQSTKGQCEVTAVDLIGAWVDAGAPESVPFPFTAEDDADCSGLFATDILPLFTTEDAWFPGSQACTECHFEISPDSRHEMDLSSYAGILTGADALSSPPGAPIILPGDWQNSVLRARLRNNRMPPDWEFEIEETNRDGPLLTLGGGDVYAVDLIAAWVDAGAPDGSFPWTNVDGAAQTGSFATDILPLFTEEDAWFTGSQACTECHFENSPDSRHEMDLSSYEGILTGADALSSPPGVPVVLPGDWANSVLRHRLRDNRMPPGWEFDIEETNRDGPLVQAGVLGAPVTERQPPTAVPTLVAASANPPPPGVPESTITETITTPTIHPVLLGLLGVLTAVFGGVIGVVLLNRFRVKGREPSVPVVATDVALLLFSLLAVSSGALSLYAVASGAFTRTHTIHEEVPYLVEVPVQVPILAEVRLEDWQAQIPAEYETLQNPFTNDPEAIAAGRRLYFSNDCQQCHGDALDGQGKFSKGLAPKPVNLTDPALINLPFMTDTYLYWRLSDGGGQSPFLSAMPAWKSMLTETERWQLIAYIRSQTADYMIDEGQQAAVAIAQQMGCFACHRSESLGRGGTIGPGWDELSEVAASRVPGLSAEEYVHQSIVDPRAFVVEGYEDQALTMPVDFGQRLSDEEMDLMVNFLLSLADDE